MSVISVPFAADSSIRKNIISASRAPYIFSLGYESRKMMMMEIFKDTKKEPSGYLQSCMDHGKYYEDTALKAFIKINEGKYQKIQDQQISFQVKVVPRSSKSSFVPSYYLIATPDALLRDRIHNKIVNVEIKCPKRAYDMGVNLRTKENAWSLFKRSYFIQIQHQMICTGIDVSYLIIFVPSKTIENNMAIFRIYRDNQYIKYMLDNYFQAMKESENENKYKSESGEKQHNQNIVDERIKTHCRYLSNLTH